MQVAPESIVLTTQALPAKTIPGWALLLGGIAVGIVGVVIFTRK